jgi:hypothetical protein
MTIEELIQKYAFHAPCTPEEFDEYDLLRKALSESDLKAVLEHQEQERNRRTREKLGRVYDAGAKISSWVGTLFSKPAGIKAPPVEPDILRKFMEGKVPPIGSA